MRYVTFPGEGTPRVLSFYLAAEEWLARNTAGGLFFMWRVDPTVICGRNQVVDLEVDLPYCRAAGIAVCRRKSGGGCVYADRSNIMFSHIADTADVATTFGAYTGRVAAMLRALGLDAGATARNDVLVGDRKVSGNAFYNLPGLRRCVVHGTMLFDSDPVVMARAITPSRAKLQSKGVVSAAARVTTLRAHLPGLSIEAFMAHARSFMCPGGEYPLPPSALPEIEALERQLSSPQWIYRKTSAAGGHRSRRIEGVGEFQVWLDARDGVIADIDIAGDFFLLSDLDSGLLAPLRGVSLQPDAIAAALESTPPETVVRGLTMPLLLDILL